LRHQRLADAFRPTIAKITTRASAIAPHHQVSIEERRDQIAAWEQRRMGVPANLP